MEQRESGREGFPEWKRLRGRERSSRRQYVVGNLIQGDAKQEKSRYHTTPVILTQWVFALVTSAIKPEGQFSALWLVTDK